MYAILPIRKTLELKESNMDLLKFSTPSDAPEWFSKFLDHYNSGNSGGLAITEETIEVFNGKNLSTAGLMVNVASGRCRLDKIINKNGLVTYSVSLPSWIVLSQARAGGVISVALPAYSSDAPKKGDLVSLGDSLAQRQVLGVRSFPTHLELTVSGGSTILNAGERVRLSREKITLAKVVVSV